MGKKIKTDNSFLEEKVKLRLDNLPNKKTIQVLDCFCGNRVIWNAIKAARPDTEFCIVGIDIKKDGDGLYLVGDNLKYITGMDLSKFDIIDIDAYGIPFKQCEALFSNPTAKGKIVFATVIQSLYGCLPKKMLNVLGYTEKMIDKIPSLFNSNGIDKFLEYLSVRGVKQVKKYSDSSNRKNYLMFVLPE